MMHYTGVITMGNENHVMLATIFVTLTEALVWIALYVHICRKKHRLPFGKLRVKCFRFLMRRTASNEWRLRWATLLFGREGYYAAKCAECLQKLDAKFPSPRKTPLTDRIAYNMAKSETPDEAA